MTNARDKANIPVLNFQSKGIDDNADATAITINSSEQVILHGGQIQNNNNTSSITYSGGNNSNAGANLTLFGGSHASTPNVARFRSSATEVMRILADGKVGIGTTTPAGAVGTDTVLEITGSVSPGLVINDTGQAQKYQLYADSTKFKMNYGSTNFLTYDASNSNLGIGTTSPSAPLAISNGGASGIELHPEIATNTNRITNYNRSGSAYNKFRLDALQQEFYISGSEKMRIDSSGHLSIGHTTSGGSKLAVCDGANAQIQFFPEISTDTNLIQHYDPTASAYMASDNRASQYLFKIGTAEKMRIDSSGNVGIGATTIDNTASGRTVLQLENSSNNLLNFYVSGSRASYLYSSLSTTNLFAVPSVPLTFGTNNTERMRIDSSGNILVGKTSQSNSTAGVELQPSGLLMATRADAPMLLNRISSDGVIVYLQQNDNTEGTISVLGATVSYNGFTGTHWSRFQDNSTPTILRGTVLETLDDMCDWYNLEFDIITTTQDEDGNDVETVRTKKIGHVLLDSQSVGDTVTYNHKGTDYQATITKETDIKHMMSKVSDNSDAKNVYGVFVAYDLDGEGYNDFYVASVGSYVVRIKQGETIAKGDLLQSNGDGTAKVQTDDNIKSSSFAKVLSTTIIETYEDGSYLVPCSLNC